MSGGHQCPLKKDGRPTGSKRILGDLVMVCEEEGGLTDNKLVIGCINQR